MLLFMMVASFVMAIGVSITLLWAAGVIKSMRIGEGSKTITIAMNILAATVALVGIVFMVYSANIFTVWLCYLTSN